MKKILLLVAFWTFGVQVSTAQDSLENTTGEHYKVLWDKQVRTADSVRYLSESIDALSIGLKTLSKENKTLKDSVDKLKDSIGNLFGDSKELREIQEADRQIVAERLDALQESTIKNETIIEDRSIYAAIILTIIIIAIAIGIYGLIIKIKKGNTSIDEVRKAQDALQNAQLKMQEESIKLDNKLLEIIDKQTKNISPQKDGNAIDHSLALKVADEIVRMELNLSRMDTSVKGHKQLSKAVQRIKDNFQANGYEIVDMLGKPYNEGMRIKANFVVDESLPENTQKITSITKPQVNYNGEMIQKAQVTISQNI